MRHLKIPREALIVGGALGTAALVTYLTRFRPRWPIGALGLKPVGLQPITSDYYHQRSGGIHGALDIGIPAGTSVRSIAMGRVHYIGYDSSSAGTYIEIDHRNTAARLAGLPGFFSRYLHLSSPTPNNPTVEVGEFVFKGEKIGESGGQPGTYGSGNTTGPHLHLEVRKGAPKKGQTIYTLSTRNPEWYLPGWKGALRKTAIITGIAGSAYAIAWAAGAT